MHTFLGVNKGSESKPRLIHLTYNGGKGEYVGLVGKGVMFDTGGYSIKTNMLNMKCDMAGAATVLGVFEAVVKNELPINLQVVRSEEHTSELQSRPHLVCRLLLEKKKKK